LKGGKNDIPDTQTAMFEFENVDVVWQHRRFGPSVDPNYAWGATLYGEKGTLKAGVYGYDFIPAERGEQPIHKDVKYELEEYPEDKTEKDLEKHVAPAVRAHMRNFLAAIDARSKPVADIEEAYISTASCILANLAMKLDRTLEIDAVKQRVVGDEEANRLFERPYRAPWVHPHPSSV